MMRSIGPTCLQQTTWARAVSRAHDADPGSLAEDIRLPIVEERLATLFSVDERGSGLAETEELLAAHPLRDGLWQHRIAALAATGTGRRRRRLRPAPRHARPISGASTRRRSPRSSSGGC
ncbi:MAG: BTAD domain-containing putative transcriptional regulator [Actinomycetota bacterium]